MKSGFFVTLEIVSDLVLFYIEANCRANTPQASPIVMSRWEVCGNSCANVQDATHAQAEPRINVFEVWPGWRSRAYLPLFFPFLFFSQIWDDWRGQKQDQSEGLLSDDGGYNQRLSDDGHPWQAGECVPPSGPHKKS